uniref:Dimethylarginine dimethylaminohydrolase n=1 Tax=Suberites domuncula TaxID=55567 RepID=Q4A3Z6_SUBDO|nr:dimethylarginine dimethylaminohydrolase [Suberites domuncula]
MAANPFTYTKAVVCGIPASLPATALRMEETDEPVDLGKARQQHEDYLQVLTELVGEVHVIPTDERYPDCVFVEDPVVVCGDTALITIPGHESRRGETVAMKEAMEKIGLKIVEMLDPGRMDGGDVLFTGKEFFVGQSQRTNKHGLQQLAAAFPNFPVTGIPVREGLHLKSFLSMATPNHIAMGSSSAALDAKQLIETEGKFKYSYRYLQVPDDIGANCLYINGTIVHANNETFPKSCKVFEKFVDADVKAKIALSASEVNKVDGCFTCCSVLIN